MLNNLSGSIIIAQTPFDDRGAIDLASIDTLTDFYLRHGANGFVVLGVSVAINFVVHLSNPLRAAGFQ